MQKIGVILLLFAVIGFAIWQKATRPRDPGATISVVEIDMRGFLSAMQEYAERYNHYPAGSPSEILSALIGNNPDKLQFMDVGQADTNSHGELLDPWQTPYKIAFDSTNRFTIRSAGKNKIFGDQDDLELSNSGEK